MEANAINNVIIKQKSYKNSTSRCNSTAKPSSSSSFFSPF